MLRLLALIAIGTSARCDEVLVICLWANCTQAPTQCTCSTLHFVTQEQLPSPSSPPALAAPGRSIPCEYSNMTCFSANTNTSLAANSAATTNLQRWRHTKRLHTSTHTRPSITSANHSLASFLVRARSSRACSTSFRLRYEGREAEAPARVHTPDIVAPRVARLSIPTASTLRRSAPTAPLPRALSQVLLQPR